MNREEFDRIANDELDGVATPEERAALKAYLSRDAEARDRYGDWKELFASLEDVGLEEAPSDLSPSVMRAVVAQHHAEAPVSRSADWVESLRSLFRAQAWRSALTFASGVGVGAAAIALVAGNLVGGARYESSDLSGAMMPRDAGPSGTLIEERTLEAGDYSVSAETRRTPDGVVLRIEASGGGADGAELVAAYDGGALHPEALRMDPPSAGEVQLGADRIRFGLQGAGTFTVSLRGEEALSAPLELELRSGAQSSRTALRLGYSESR